MNELATILYLPLILASFALGIFIGRLSMKPVPYIEDELEIPDKKTLKLPIIREKINADIRKNVFVRDSYTCLECGRTNCCSWHVGHIIPVSQGGSNEPSNLYTSCAGCNLKRGNKRFASLDLEATVKRRAI